MINQPGEDHDIHDPRGSKLIQTGSQLPDLRLLSFKVLGIAELRFSYKGGETSGREEQAFYGLATILQEIAIELQNVADGSVVTHE